VLNYLVTVFLLFSAAIAHGKTLEKQLDGEWKLVSSEQVKSDGTRSPNPLYGPGGIGFLVFAEGGEMCAILAAPSPSNGGLDAYCGKYQLNEAEQSIVFDVVFDAVPNDLGDRLKRTISFEGDNLKLRAMKPHPGIEEYTLTWTRM
jgi:hypothetical protein